MKKSLLIFSFIFVIAGSLLAQVTVTGQIKSSARDPLPGVPIAVKGTATGTISDADGKHTISVPSSDASLVFSFMGMLPETVLVATQTKIDVTLLENIKTLEEVVVVGYGSQKRGDLTSAVEVINPKTVQDLKNPI